MKTKPVKNILPDNYKNEESEVFETLAKFSSDLEEVINYGTKIFKWCNEATKGKADAKVPLILSFRHCLELFDAISILIKKSSIEPCKLQLRAIFESLLTINCILEKDTKKRGYAFLVYHVHKRIKLHEKFDSSTERGKQLKAELKDSAFDGLSLDIDWDSSERVDELKNIFEQEGYSEAEKEYQNLIASGNKNPDWYEFYGGPPTIEQLAQKLNKTGYYEILYRKWSEYIHSTDIINDNIGSTNDQTYLKAIRQPFNAEIIASFTTSFALELYSQMIDHFVPEKMSQYKIWFKQEVRDFYQAVSSEEKIINKK